MSEANQQNDKQQIHELLEKNRQAAIDSDTAAMEVILADEWVNVSPLGSKVLKPQLLRSFRNGDINTSSIEVEELELKLYGEAAVARAIYHMKTTIRGEYLDYHIFRTDVFAKPAMKWQIVSTHVTEIMPPAPGQ